MQATSSPVIPSQEKAVAVAPIEVGYSALVWRRLRRDRVAMFGAALVGLLIIVALFAPFIAPHDPAEPRAVRDVPPRSHTSCLPRPRPVPLHPFLALELLLPTLVSHSALSRLPVVSGAAPSIVRGFLYERFHS